MKPRRSASLRACLVVSLCLGACGYRSGVTGEPGAPRYAVAGAASLSPHPEAVEAALAGARAELGRAESLGGGGHPRIIVQLVRVDEVAAGIQATRRRGERLPLARGAAVGVVVRAWVETAPGVPPTRQSADVRRVEVVAQGEATGASGAAFRAAVRAAARRAGEAAARQVIGRAEPSVEPI